MISVVTRVQHPVLYQRMKMSASNHAWSEIDFLSEIDTVGLPKISETYNRLGSESKADVIVFAHDDAVFMTPGWDELLLQEFKNNDVEVLGVVGTDKYEGGRLFSAGWPHAKGKYVCHVDGRPYVKVYSKREDFVQVKAVDPFFMAVRGDHFERVKFSPELDELWFYDLDFCLRSRVGVIDLLMGHHKPPHLVGVYPPGMKPIEAYWKDFHEKHGLSNVAPSDDRCALATMEDFLKLGQDVIVSQFENKYMRGSDAKN